MVSIPACHAGDRGSIPRRGGPIFSFDFFSNWPNRKIIHFFHQIKNSNLILFKGTSCVNVLDSIVVSIPACHAGDRGSIPRRGGFFLLG